MKTENLHNVYFIGAGGIGMSALARYFNIIGKNVAGYDRTATLLTESLLLEGIEIHFSDDIDLIPIGFKNPDNTLVVRTPAVPENHSELNWFRQNGFSIMKRAEVLGLITEDLTTIAVAGTHGKTTVSTMIAHIMKNSSIDCNAFIGGISKNFTSNLLISKTSRYVVVEADEFDRSFLHLRPQIAVVTAIDADHLDIYGSELEIQLSFADFISRIDSDGVLIFKKDIAFKPDDIMPDKSYYYSINTEADFFASNIRVVDGYHIFDFYGPSIAIKDLELGLPGRFNVENAVAASSACWFAGVSEDEIRDALKSFRGSKRRFEYVLNTDNQVYIDDYAHHPEELKACIGATRELFPNKKITGIFQPHLYSRTRDFADEFAKSLSMLDELILLEIYPAREEPIPGVSAHIIFDKVTIKDKTLCHKGELMDFLKTKKSDVLLTMGAGDIDQFTEPIKDLLLNR